MNQTFSHVLGLALPFFLVTALGCAGADSGTDPADEAALDDGSEAQASELHGTCRGLVAKDSTHYGASEVNAGRELAAALSSSFVTNFPAGGGSAFVPNVLRARSSTSPYELAARVDLAVWSSMSTTSFDGVATNGALYVRVQGNSTGATRRAYTAAKALFDGMTNATQTFENEAVVRRSAKGSVTCAKGTGYIQCVLGPFDSVDDTATCPR